LMLLDLFLLVFIAVVLLNETSPHQHRRISGVLEGYTNMVPCIFTVKM
jgi:hypothetical protein